MATGAFLMRIKGRMHQAADRFQRAATDRMMRAADRVKQAAESLRVTSHATLVVGHAIVVLVSKESDSERIQWHLQKAAESMNNVTVESLKQEIRTLITSDNPVASASAVLNVK
jgi:hypothetical protein